MTIEGELERLDEELEASPGNPMLWERSLAEYERAGRLPAGLEVVWAALARHEAGGGPDATLRERLCRLAWRFDLPLSEARLRAQGRLEHFLHVVDPGGDPPGLSGPAEGLGAWRPLARSAEGLLLEVPAAAGGGATRVVDGTGAERARIPDEGELAWACLQDNMLLTIGVDLGMHLYNFGTLRGEELRPRRHFTLAEWGDLEGVDYGRTFMAFSYLLLVARHGEEEDLWFFWMGSDDPPSPKTMRLPPGGGPYAVLATSDGGTVDLREVAWAVADGAIERRRVSKWGGFGQREPHAVLPSDGGPVTDLAYQGDALWVAQGRELSRRSLPPLAEGS